MILLYELNFNKSKIVYVLNNKEIGYIVYEDAIDFINIVDVFVEESFRNNGYATKMFNYMFNLFKNRNVKFMLEVREDNFNAINLYEKLGFKKIHVRKKYYKDVDAVIMEVIK